MPTCRRSLSPRALRSTAFGWTSRGRRSIKDKRRYPDRPILGVGAIILNRERILLVERGKQPLKGYWSLPGGVLEIGETLEEGIRREVLEETGLMVEPLGVVEIFERIMRDRRGRRSITTCWSITCAGCGWNAGAASDVSRADWVPRRYLPRYWITDGTLAVIEKGFRERRQYRKK